MPGDAGRGGPGDWTEALIGTSGTDRPWAGLLESASPLVWLAPPDELERAAETLEGLAERGAGKPGLASDAEWLRALATMARVCVSDVERDGLRWDWERRAVVGPKGEPGRPRTSQALAVEAAYLQLRPARNRRYHRETFAAIRDRLCDLLPPEELTDARIKARIQEYERRRAGRE